MITLTAKIEKRELDKYLKRLDKNRDKPLHVRVERNIRAASQRVLVPRLKKGLPKGPGRMEAGGRKRGGNLRRKAKAKLVRKRAGEVIRPTWTGSSAHTMHMLTGGTVGHSLAPTGDRTVNIRGRSVTFRPKAQSEFVTFPAGGELLVRPGAKVHVEGITPRNYIDQLVTPALPSAYALIERDAFDTR